MAESPSELLAEIEKLERKHAENPEGRYFVPLANAYRKQGDLERAESLLREGLRRHPDYLSAHIVLGRSLADRQAAREAADEFRYVLSLDPQNLIALRTLGELATSEGRHDEATRWYQELLSVDPMNEDARRALESLSVAPSEPAEEFQQGAAWWERPAEPEEEKTLPPQDHGLREPEPLPQEPPPAEPDGDRFAAASLDDARDDEPLRIQTAADTFAGAGLDLDAGWSAAEPPAEEQPGLEEPGAREPEPLQPADAEAPYAGFGRLDDIDFPAAPPEEAPEPGAEEPETELVTETIAELYARQGFYGRSAEVYRELIRRRGGDAALQQRLEEVERLAQEHAEPTAPALDHEEPAAGDDLVLTGYGDTSPEPAAAEEEEPEPKAAAQEEAGADDGWLTAVSDFVMDEEPGVGQGESAGEEPDAASDPFAASFQDGFGDLGEAAEPEPLEPAAAEPEPEPEAETSRQPTIAAFLSGLAGWRSGAAEPAAAEPEPEPLPGWDEPAAEPDELAATEPEAESGTMSAGAEPFPWELPSLAGGAPQPAADPGPEEAAEDEAEDSFSFGGVESPAPPADPTPSAPAAPAPPAPGASAAPDAGDEDEDLESFQAWLRSLKR